MPKKELHNMKSQNTVLIPVLLINFIGTLGFGLVLPFLVFVVKDFGGNEIIYGILSAVYPAFQLIGAPILGSWSDRFGRRKILLLSQAGTLLAWVVFLVAFFLPIQTIFSIQNEFLGTLLFTLPLLVLFLARALDGITGGNVSVANAYLADISTEETRKRNFGLMGASASLGFIAGPMISGLLSSTIYGEKLPVFIAILISFTAMILIYFFLPEYEPEQDDDLISNQPRQIQKVFGQEIKDCKNNDEGNPTSKTKKMSFIELWKYKNVSVFFVLYFLIFLGFNFFYASFPMQAANNLKWSPTELGTFFSILSLLMALVQGVLMSYFGKLTSEKNLVVIGSFILVINFILFYLSSDFWTYSATLFFALGNGIAWTSFSSLLSASTEKRYQGIVQGTAQSFGSLSSIIGLILGGFLFANLGAGVFLISAAILFLVAIVAWIKLE
jgi:MFS family permease